jgi:4-amino-4-deoxy-L-arabinose transferase-like glycosyltransferase
VPGGKQRSSLGQAVRRFWPAGAPGYALAGLLLAGIALRLVAVISWWPTASTLDDGYQLYAESNPFTDPQHPAGYGLILAAIGALTREVAVPVLLQHLVGLASALLLFAATRRVTRSEWAGLLPAAIVLLNPDQVFLEHAIMSETWAVLTISVGFYAAVRSFDEPDPWWRWSALTGAALALGVVIRTAGLLAIPVAVLALLLCRHRPFAAWREHWRAPVAAAGVAAVVLLGFATANATFGERFGLGPSQGWYLYGRAAQFADCDRFTPPPGTEVLCEEVPAAERPGAYYYLFDPQAPAPRQFGGFGANDELVGEWARRAIRAQPGDYLSTTWEYLRAYWLSGLSPSGGTNLDPQLDYTAGSLFEADIERSLESFYNEFAVDRDQPGLEFLRGWQEVIRFGGTALAVTTVLVLIGLLVGPRRSRVGVLLFGIGGLALLVAPVLTGNYVGRYTVPMAGPLTAATAIAIVALWRRWSARGQPDRQPAGRDSAPAAPAQT